ncbi:MAG: metallophosphoesterase [Chthoniobacteraceae bacterium]
MKNINPTYDLIGDIHGQADALRGLLAQLGYREERGAFRHPERTAIFVGDFIDRGPRIRETLRIVRAMVDAGSALAVMGNHEYDAVCLHTENGSGGWVMERSAAKMSYHRSTLDDFYGIEAEWREWLGWMKALPLALDLGGLRVAHAMWSDAAVAGLPRTIDDDWLRASRVRGTNESAAARALLKGREVELPEGCTFIDKAGNAHGEVRVRWWLDPAGLTYFAACLPQSDAMPDVPIPTALIDGWRPYAPDAPPVFIGHYWLPGPPELLAPNVACVDYSVAKGGPLVAYRWNGERELRAENFVCGPRGV